MNGDTMFTRANLLLALLGLVLVAACAEERDPIDRVQPYALPKTFFVGEDFIDASDNPEFWTQATLIDVGYGASQDGLFTSTYAQPLSHMRFEITEDHLIGRLSHERIEGSDGKGVGGPVEDGVIVAVFKISKHFDVTNAYNSTTGEQLNIVEENASDRPWYEREYMRVDWSKNLNTDAYDFDTLSLLGVYGSIDYESLAYYVDDPNHPDALVFNIEEGYFDVTTKAFAKPKLVDLSHLGWGIDSFPACFLDNDFFGGSAPAGTCNPVELTLRTSFRRVVDTDYEPLEWDGYRFQAYGGFYDERYGYSPNYGMTDELWHRFLDRYDIWERSHRYDDPAAMTGEVPCYTPDTTPYGADPRRDENMDGTHDECVAAGVGSKCDTFRQRCTLPYAERKAQTTVWYYAQGSDPRYYDATELATHNWDVAFRTSVATAKYGECMATGGADCETRFPMYFGQQGENNDALALSLEMDDCRAKRSYVELNGAEDACGNKINEIAGQRGYGPGVVAVAKMKEMIVLCHSPVEANDHPSCGSPRLPEGITAEHCFDAHNDNDLELLAVCREALNVRRGDLRYHQVNAITEPATPSPWGIYVDANDPLTGQTISASINVWTWVNGLWAQRLVDKLRYVKGELTTEQVTEGQYIDDYSIASAAASGKGALPTLTRDERSDMLQQFARASLGHDHAHHVDEEEVGNPVDLAEAHPELMKAALAIREEAKDIMATSEITSSMSPTYNARMRHARGTDFEAQLMTRPMQQLHGVEGMNLSDGLMDIVSPLRGGNPSFQRELKQAKENAYAKRGMCVLSSEMSQMPTSTGDLANILEEKFGAFNPEDSKPDQEARAQKMINYIAQRAHMSVIVHEMGHSVGLRHNFVSSSDAFSYRPQYWQLRTKNGAVEDNCTTLTDGEDCAGPRYYDPITEGEKSNMIWMFMHSSVMEYAGEASQDFLGLGSYDFAAARMFYGDMVSVYADDFWKQGTPASTLALEKMNNFGGILGIAHKWEGDDIHYSALNKHINLISNCKEIDPYAFKPARWDEETNGAWHPVLDGLMVEVDGAWKRCKQPRVDYVPWDNLSFPTSFTSTGGYFRGDRAFDPAGRTRVPHGFATDGWADLGNLSVYRHDNGADAYEIFNFLITSQEMDHIFNNYRRGRTTFSVRSASGRTLGRYNEKLRDGAKGLGLMRNIYESFSMAQGYDFNYFWRYFAPQFFPENILASSMVFDHFARTLTRPQAGPHFRLYGNPVLQSVDDYIGNAGGTVVTVPNGATGRYGNVSPGGHLVENRLAEDQGEYDSRITTNCGSYYDKVNAPYLFTESIDNFISSSRGDFTDARYRAVSLADLFPDGYRRMLANMLTNDDELKGPRIETDGSGAPILDEAGFPLYGIGWTSWWGDEPKVCFPADGSPVCTSFGVTDDSPFGGHEASNTAVLDPQVDWEQQKFLIANTLLYVPENQKQRWINMMRIWEMGADTDPGFENRIEFHHPNGKIYVAKTYGKEMVFGKEVQKGIAARVLEYANGLLKAAYLTNNGRDLDNDGNPDWYTPMLDPLSGEPVIIWDQSLVAIGPDGYTVPGGVEGCNANDYTGCTCSSNRACVELEDYISVPYFLRQAITAYGLADPEKKGIWN